MNHRRIIDDFKRGVVDRRTLSKAMASLGIVAAAVPLGRPAKAEIKQPVLFEWSGYEVPELYPAYVAKYGRQPEWTNFADTTEAFTKMRAGFQVDLAHPCTGDMTRWTDAGLLAPIDTGRLSNWGDVFPALKSQNGVNYNDQVFFAPTDWGNSSVVYRTDLVDTEESWYMLFDEKYAGKISPWDSVDNVYAAAAVLGLDMTNLSDEELNGPVADLLRQQRGLVRNYWSTATELDQLLASGEVVAAYAWNETYKRLKEQGLPVAYARPKEGIWGWCCGLVKVAGGEGDEQAVYDLIDAWMAPEAGKYLIEAFGYGHSNAKSFEVADPDIVASLGLTNPEALMANSVFLGPLDPSVDERYNRLWEEIQAGS